MHELGFVVVTAKKGAFVDVHERENVVEYRKIFLRSKVAMGFLNLSNTLTENAKLALPKDSQCPPKTVIFFHDGSTFQSNEDQFTLWATEGTKVLRPNRKELA